MNDESTSAVNPVGLYHDPESGQYIGAIDPIQADAFVRAGYQLHTEGRDAAMSSQEDIDALKGIKTTSLPAGGETFEPSTNKKGK
jgi:hypothetical protein